MKHWGPLVTAVVMVLGLIGFMVVNTAGGLVVAKQTQENPPPTTTAAPTTTTVPEEPAGPQFPAEQVYAGTAVESKGLAIAIAVKGDKAAAYLCDGSQIEAWLKGSVKDGVLNVTAADDSAFLTAKLAEDGGLEGEGETAGAEFTFDLDVAEPPAGLYRGEVGNATIGWIVLPDGSQVGIASSPDGSGPAPELDPEQGSVEVGGQQVEAAKVDGDTEF